ncbi:MAG: DUF5615 family PIN-like protein [Gammaproteobacteria bacterium]|nr:DUF5615 family PIN-like protein [Gammaproteobacteria bacterium]
MNLLADESVDRGVDRLRSDGHSVQYVAELDPGIDDDAVLYRANQNGALLVTVDRDFGELVFRLGRIHAGVVLIRLAGLSPEAKAETVASVFATRRDELVSAFSVVSPGRVRIRRPANGS